jgi:hypothetical protein
MTTKMDVPTVVNVLGVPDRAGVETVALKLCRVRVCQIFGVTGSCLG